MPDEKATNRIKEAEANIRQYLQDGLIKKEKFQEIVFDVLKGNALESLETANFLHKNSKSYLWVIVTSYYSMYYMANAIIYKIGYKIGNQISHKVTADALFTFVRKKLANNILQSYEEMKDEALATIKSNEIVESFDSERKKRGLVQYSTTPLQKRSKAETSLKRATEFVHEMEKLLQ